MHFTVQMMFSFSKRNLGCNLLMMLSKSDPSSSCSLFLENNQALSPPNCIVWIMVPTDQDAGLTSSFEKCFLPPTYDIIFRIVS